MGAPDWRAASFFRQSGQAARTRDLVVDKWDSDREPIDLKGIGLVDAWASTAAGPKHKRKTTPKLVSVASAPSPVT